MAFGMAKWAKANWQVHTEEDLDEYTYYVAGLVGVMLSDLMGMGLWCKNRSGVSYWLWPRFTSGKYFTKSRRRLRDTWC